MADLPMSSSERADLHALRDPQARVTLVAIRVYHGGTDRYTMGGQTISLEPASVGWTVRSKSYAMTADQTWWRPTRASAMRKIGNEVGRELVHHPSYNAVERLAAFSTSSEEAKGNG